MKIYIKQKGRRSLFIPVPFLVLKIILNNRLKKFVLRYTKGECVKYIESIDFREIYNVLKILRSYKGLEMVNVKDKEQNIVKIVI
ncbi:hypothetical protein RBU49_16575 [Clostridium sp. MB40-C1]|uniref:hypothetical protein n=1 Tax=Clostridium sp. MB40-C1 TaxID=3070996 RepID=UPI0027E19E69|nr:hypothetical protein [Clostridium sp. MB40-C1]WMJ80397.1 hypothetical protein RBU49_16575 [Clostridium sp. MB40-C1]